MRRPKHRKGIGHRDFDFGWKVRICSVGSCGQVVMTKGNVGLWHGHGLLKICNSVSQNVKGE